MSMGHEEEGAEAAAVPEQVRIIGDRKITCSGRRSCGPQLTGDLLFQDFSIGGSEMRLSNHDQQHP